MSYNYSNYQNNPYPVQYFYDVYGNPYSYDQFGEIYYYAQNGSIYYLEDTGHPYFYDESGSKIYFEFDKFGNFIILSSDSDKTITSLPETSKKTLSKEELFYLFDITNRNPNIKMPFLSDHSIIWYKIKEDGQNLIIASWNLLGRGKILEYPKKKFNNPFQLIESQEQYENRFIEQASKMIQIIKKINGLSLFLLQEARILFEEDNSVTNNFISELNSLNWTIIKVIDGPKLFNVILSNENRFQLIEPPINVFKTFTKPRSILQINLKDKLTNKNILIGNVHLSPPFFKRNLINYIEDIKNKFAENTLGIWGGDTNTLTQKGIFVGNGKYPTLIRKNKSLGRSDYFFFYIPIGRKLIVKEMPTCFFDEDGQMSLSSKTVLELDSSYMKIDKIEIETKYDFELEYSKKPKKNPKKKIDKIKTKNTSNQINDLIKKLSQKMDLRHEPYGKIFITYEEDIKKYIVTIYGDNKFTTFRNFIKPMILENIRFGNRQDSLKNVYEMKFDKEEMGFVFKKYLDPAYYSLIINEEDQFSIANKDDLFQKYIPFKREKKIKPQILL